MLKDGSCEDRMIPKSKYYTPQVSSSGKYVYYRFPTLWTTGETCAIEPTKSGAIITFPGTVELVPESKLDGTCRYMRAKVAAGLLPVCKYRLDRYDDRLEIVWRKRNERVQD